MDKFSGELDYLKRALSSALDRVDALSALIDASSKQPIESVSHSEPMDDSQLIEQAENLLKWSHKKSRALNQSTGLFSDPCWNMCLDIYICDLKDQQIPLSSVAHSSGIPMTTAMRYLNVLTEEGLLEKVSNPSDSRMIFISTSGTFRQKITSVLDSLP